MITARQFRTGNAVEINKTLFLVVASQHIKPGKGGAFVRTKLKNLKTHAISERTFRPQDSFPQAYIETKKMQCLYRDHSGYHFMDQSTFEQVAIGEDILGETIKFLKDGMDVTISAHKGSVVGISLPAFVNLKVTYTEPGIRGDTAKGGSKPATLETRASIRVPLFINTGDHIKIDTRRCEYAGRA